LTKLEEYKFLLERSRRFYETALMQISRRFYDLAAFSLEQSLQLYLKAHLLKLGLDYPRTHSVRRPSTFKHSTSKHSVHNTVRRQTNTWKQRRSTKLPLQKILRNTRHKRTT